MRIEVIHAGNFMLDGGAMFGSVPKSIWNKKYPSDANNMCNWAMRCLFIEDGNRKILIDTGIGDKQSEKFFGYYFLNGENSLRKSLNKIGVDFSDITDVILTHLHFDHCGGATHWNSGKTMIETSFPNAVYWTHKKHWEHALDSNPREKASFLSENLRPLEESGQLKYVGSNLKISENIDVLLAHGHTESMMCPVITNGDKRVLYAADLVPSVVHIPANYVMSYDIRPLQSMKEHALILDSFCGENDAIFFEHDVNNECARIAKNDRGRLVLKEALSLKNFLA